MKFLVDEQLPPALADWLRTRGHEAEHVHTAGLGAADDKTIWRYAREGGWIIVTKDEDFAAHRAAAAGPSILWLRVGNAMNSVLLAQMETHWLAIAPLLEAGEPIVELR
ncbi:MAG TPA: DUF5615 family PIN-like protein [Caulobacteraceae bacterium]|nr:DUF5615 family PIN-like protein [Caulobacteraceae bacterium]